MKKLRAWALALGILTVGSFIIAAGTDITALQGGGSLNNVDVFRITSTGDVKITDSSSYTALDIDSSSGRLTLGKAIAPATTAIDLPSIRVPIKNDDTVAWAQGDLIVLDPDCAGCGKIGGATNDLTTFLGIAYEATAAGAVGYVITEGYAVAKTTGTVNRGDTLVTTTAAAGRLTGDSTPTTGADVAVAVSSGVAAGGTAVVYVK